MAKFIAQLLMLCTLTASAQIVTVPVNNATQLAQILAGNGVTITNAVMNCPGTSAGTFNCQNCNLGMTTGIALTSGSVNNIPGPNNLGSSGIDNLAPGNAQLNTLANSTTYDACVLEFDMQVQSDSVEFRYVFGSEEYLEWVNASFNDAFAFFISGPGIAGQQNIAIVPGTVATPVSIDNVNSTANSMYYVNNGTGFTAPQNTSNYYIQYDGFTTVLTAKRKNLQPCQTYHMRLMVADAGDGIYDSGVFLAENSLTSNFVSVDDAETNDPATTNAMEGCVNGVIRFRLQQPVTVPTTVNYTIGGSATNGVDYNNLNGTITIPAGQTTTTLNIIPTADGLVEGNETLVIYLNSPCNNVPYDSAVLLIVDSLPFLVGPDTAICAGQQVQLMGSLASTYAWTPAASLNATNIYNPIATPTATTVYRCNATIGACQRYDSAIVTLMPAPFSVNAGPDVTICTGAAPTLNAVATGTPVNGNPFTYSWSPNTGLSSTIIPNPQANPTAQTNYVIQVSSGGCIASDTVAVLLGNLSISLSSTDQNCFGVNDGTVTLTLNTGTAPITYSWSNNATTQNISNLNGGTYTVNVSDALGCNATATATVAAAAPINFSTPSITHVSCFGDNTGSINITANGGSGISGYLWSNSFTGNSPNQLTAGTYSVTASDTKGCTAETSITVNEPSQLSVMMNSTNISCYGATNGTGTVTVTGGTTPYGYAWSNSATTNSISNLGAGSYNFTVTDANSCTVSAGFTITAPSSPVSVSISTTAETCFAASNGTASATVSGGTPFYTYLWSNSATTLNISSLTGNTYSISVTDNNGCTASASGVVNAANAVTFNQPIISHVSCFGGNDGTMTITANGGAGSFNYVWNIGGTGTTASSLAAGIYTVTATDANNCPNSTSATVIEPPLLQATATSTNSTCFAADNGTATVVATGGTTPYSYAWNSGQSTPSINGLYPTNYLVTVTDSKSCTASAITSTSEPAELSAVLASTPVTCTYSTDGTISTTMINGFAPYTYDLMWSNTLQQTNGTGTFGNLTASTYTVKVTDVTNCTTSSTVTILPPYPDEFTYTVDSTTCFGAEFNDGEVHIQVISTINQPYYFSIDNGGSQISPDFSFLSAGTHQLQLVNKNGCITDTTVFVPQPTQGIATALPLDSTIQLGEQITLSGILSGYNTIAITGYDWQPSEGLSCTDCPNPVMQGYVTNTYYLTITYHNGCTATAATKIIVEGLPPVYIPNAFSPNGDGNNDVFMVYGENILNVMLTVYNRWGEKIFDSQNERFAGWDGTYKSVLQNPGVFTYVADITYLNSKKTQHKGTVTLLK